VYSVAEPDEKVVFRSSFFSVFMVGVMLFQRINIGHFYRIDEVAKGI